MTQAVNIYIAQLNPTVGAIDANVAAIAAAHARAHEATADLMVTPELSVIGYPPEDLVMKPFFQRQAKKAVEGLAKLTQGGKPAMLVGSCWVIDGELYNVVLLLDGGEIKDIIIKYQLPNYGVFDEMRVFKAADSPQDPIEFRGLKLGVMVCEDMWFADSAAHAKARGADVLIVPTCSPFEIDKHSERLDHAKRRVAETGLPLMFVNQISGQDELVFEGASYVLNEDGAMLLQMKAWTEHEYLTSWVKSPNGWKCETQHKENIPQGLEAIYQAMVLGLRDYVRKNHFPGVVLGLSGGVDSALSAAVAVDALGADKVDCVMMPSKYTGDESLSDAAGNAENLGVNYTTIAIKPGVEAFDTMLEGAFKDTSPDTTEENIQSRLRGMILMSLSNKFGRMVLTTGNKSEMSVGYATLYGDMCGGYSVLKDVYKTTAFDLCRWRNAHVPEGGLGPSGEVIPDNIITKPPTAELREDQRDDDSLPPYEALDDMLRCLVDEEMSAADVVARGHSIEEVARIEHLLYIAEYKRRQSPPGVKLTRRNYGRDRRYPITNGFRSARK